MRLWKLLHILFGWEYAHLENSATQIIRRVHYTTFDEPYCVYFDAHFVWLNRPDGWTVTPLV